MGLSKSFVNGKAKAAARWPRGLTAIQARRDRIRSRHIAIERVQGVREVPEKPREPDAVERLPIRKTRRKKSAAEKVVERRVRVNSLVADADLHPQNKPLPNDVPVQVEARCDPDGTLVITLRIGIVERHY